MLGGARSPQMASVKRGIQTLIEVNRIFLHHLPRTDDRTQRKSNYRYLPITDDMNEEYVLTY